MQPLRKCNPALQIRTGQRSITTNLLPLTAHIYHVMIIVTSSFSRRSFFINIFFCWYFFFLKFSLNDIELVFLEFKLIYKTRRTSLFSFCLFIFFTRCCIIILCINVLHLFLVFHCL